MTGSQGPFRDEDEFASFHRETARGLWSYLYYLGQDRALADELTQESYLRLLLAAGRLERGPGLRGYLYRIAHRLFVDHTRRRSLERAWMPFSHSSEAFREAEGDGQRQAARALRSRTECDDLLRRLTERERELLWLAYGEGADHRDIAARAGLREKSVKVLLHRARRKALAIMGWERDGR
jgi:RNA polymerase sigma-70 factor (ECF subfamily)